MWHCNHQKRRGGGKEEKRRDLSVLELEHVRRQGCHHQLDGGQGLQFLWLVQLIRRIHHPSSPLHSREPVKVSQMCIEQAQFLEDGKFMFRCQQQLDSNTNDVLIQQGGMLLLGTGRQQRVAKIKRSPEAQKQTDECVCV